MDRLVIEYFVGVDLGQVHDFTAVCVLEAERAWSGFNSIGRPVDTPIPAQEQRRRISHLERLPLGMSYPAMVERISQLLQNLPRAGRGYYEPGIADVNLVVDQTGVGRPVIDMLHAAGLNPIPVTITGGDAVNHDNDGWKVPKRDLVSKIKILQQRRMLQVQEQLPLASVLSKELQNFRYKISLRGHDSYNAGTSGEWRREGGHDDLVLAVALACWAADENVSRRATWDPDPFADFVRGRDW
jgi:hypothetical protein